MQTLHLPKAPSLPGLRLRQTAFQEAHPTMKGRVHLSVNSFAGSPVSKPQSSYWVPETLHSTKPHSDLSASYSSARYWVSLSRWWSSSQAKFQPAVLPGLWGVLAVQLYCCVALSLIDLQRFVKDWRSLIPLFEFLFSLVSRAGFCNISWYDFFITRLSLGRLNSFHLTNITFKKKQTFLSFVLDRHLFTYIRYEPFC